MNKLFLFVIMCGFLSCNNKPKEETLIKPDEVIYLWYCSFKSIEEKNNQHNLYESLNDNGSITFKNIVFNDKEHKDFRIKIYRALMELDESWKFEIQNLNYNNVGKYHYLIKVDTYFSKGNEKIFMEEMYYYNHLGNEDDYLGYFVPIPLEDKIFLLTGEEIKTLKGSEIWNGGYEINR